MKPIFAACRFVIYMALHAPGAEYPRRYQWTTTLMDGLTGIHVSGCAGVSQHRSNEIVFCARILTTKGNHELVLMMIINSIMLDHNVTSLAEKKRSAATLEVCNVNFVDGACDPKTTCPLSRHEARLRACNFPRL